MAVTAQNSALLDENLKLLIAQLEGLGYDAAQIKNMVENGILTDMDFYHTFIRIWQVMSAVIANGTSSDALNPNSHYEQTMSNSLFLQSFLTIFTLIPAAIGAYFAYKDIQTLREQNGSAYQLKEIKKVNPQTKLTDEPALLESYNDFLRREKVYFRPQPPVEPPPPKKPTTEVDVPLFGKVEVKTTYYDAAIKVKNVVTSVWDKIVRASLIFWPIWFVGVLVVGMAAVSLAPAAIIIAALSVVSAIAYFASLAFLKTKSDAKYDLKDKDGKKETNEELIKKEVERIDYHSKELSRMRDEVKMRQHMKQDFAFFKRVFNIAKKEKPSNQITPAFTAKALKADGTIYFEKNLKAPSEKASVKLTANDTEKSTSLLSSKLYQKLIGSESSHKGRIALNAAFRALGRYAMTVFGLWLVAVVLGAIAMTTTGIIAAACTAVANWVGSGWTAFFLGVGLGAIEGTQMYKSSKKIETKRQNTIEAHLLEPATENIPGIDNPNKAEAFEYFEAAVENKKKTLAPKLLAAQNKLQARVEKEGIDALSEAEKVILNFKLKDIDVYNDHYFKTQQPESVWAKIRNALHYGFNSLYTAQTGVLIVRTLFLAGGAVAAFFLLSPPVFMAVAAITALAMGIAKGVQIYLNKKAEKSLFFADTIEARTSWLKKQDKKLAAIDNYLENEVAASATATALALFKQKQTKTPQAGVKQIVVPAYVAKAADVVVKVQDASAKAKASVSGLLSHSKKAVIPQSAAGTCAGTILTP